MAKIIGFIPVFNVYSQGYPFLEAIFSHLNVCDDIYILDASTPTDSTSKILSKMTNKRIHIYHKNINLNLKNTKNGEIIRELSNYLLNIIKNEEKDEETYVFYFQANEIIHEDDYKFIKQLLKYFPNYLGYLFNYYELFGRYLFGEQYRLRIAKLTNKLFVHGDGWTLINTGIDFHYITSIIYSNAESLLRYRNVNDAFFTNYHRYRYVYTPKPIYRYSRVFPYNTMLKLKMHKKLFRNSYFSNLKVSQNYKNADNFFKELCKNEYKLAEAQRLERPNCKKILNHPRIMTDLLDRPKYYIRPWLLRKLNKL